MNIGHKYATIERATHDNLIHNPVIVQPLIWKHSGVSSLFDRIQKGVKCHTLSKHDSSKQPKPILHERQAHPRDFTT